MMENTSTSLRTRKRSVGVTVIGILCIIYSTLHFLLIPNPLTKEMASFMLESTFILLIVFIILSWAEIIGFFIGGIGVLKLISWARKVVIIAAILGIPNWIYAGILGARWMVENKLSLFPELHTQIPDTFLFVISTITTSVFAIFNLLCIYFFTRPKVKAQFSPAKPTT